MAAALIKLAAAELLVLTAASAKSAAAESSVLAETCVKSAETELLAVAAELSDAITESTASAEWLETVAVSAATGLLATGLLATELLTAELLTAVLFAVGSTTAFVIGTILFPPPDTSGFSVIASSFVKLSSLDTNTPSFCVSCVLGNILESPLMIKHSRWYHLLYHNNFRQKIQEISCNIFQRKGKEFVLVES